jgi:hypothetical protein
MFQRSGCHHQILGTKLLTLSKFHPKDSQFCSGLSTTLLSCTYMLCAHELIRILVCKGKTVMIVLKILGINVQGARDLCTTGCNVIQLADEMFASTRK